MAASYKPTPDKYSSKLRGKRVLVLGGTSGIGFCVAEASIEAGAIVVISSSRPSKIDDKIKQLRSSYPDCVSRLSGRPCDLATTDRIETNIESLLKFATNDGKDKLDHVVFTAGDTVGVRNLKEATIESIQKAGVVHFAGPVLLAKHLVPGYMTSSAELSITLTSGMIGTKPGPGWGPMAGWATAVEGAARGLAVDLKPIRVNCVTPGVVHTELVSSFAGDRLEEVLQRSRDSTITKTVARPDDLAETYLYCMKDHFVTGSVLHSNGGYLLA